MRDLADFQRDFAAAILADDQPAPPLRSLAFDVYRNTSARGIVEALRASFPTIDALLGTDMFTQIALDYRREAPPVGPILSDHGATFAGWLARQPWTSELPYVADVATIDWLWLQSFLAGDRKSLAEPSRDDARIMLHPAARFAWLATPALTIWQAHRTPCGVDELEPEWREEGVLVVRPANEVGVHPLDPACHRLLLACSVPARVDEIVAAVAEAFPQSDVPELLQQCVTSGALIIR